MKNELETARALVDLAAKMPEPDAFSSGPTRAQRLKELYSEAQQSGDIYRQRAAGEVFRALSPEIGGTNRTEVFSLSKQAERDLINLRVTDEMVNAADTREAATLAILEKRRELVEVAEALGEDLNNIFAAPTELVKAIRRVTIDENRQMQVLTADHSRITGVIWKTEQGESDNE